MVVVPDISKELVTYLDHTFPDRLSLIQKLGGSVDAAKGARAVVDHLVQLHKDQQENSNVLRQQVTTPGAERASTAAPASG